MTSNRFKVEALINVVVQLVFNGEIPDEKTSWNEDLIESIKSLEALRGLEFCVDDNDKETISIYMLLKSNGVVLKAFFTPLTFYKALNDAITNWLVEIPLDLPINHM